MTPDELLALSRRETRLSLRELAKLAEMSKRKLLDDVRRGDLIIVKQRTCTRWRYLVEPIEAVRYLTDLYPAA